jgi:ATP11 protein
VLIQFQGKHCLITYLEDYKANPAAAMPYSTLTLFDELVDKKGLVLIRGDVTNNLSRQEAMR